MSKTHCIHGHELTPENSIFEARGYTRCRTCKYQGYRTPAPHALVCAECGQPRRRAGEYVCRPCASVMPGGPAFNHVRPPEMQGRAVSIFSSYGSGSRG